MSWIKKATITSFNGPPKTPEEAKQRYFSGDEMVRYHSVYDLYKMGDLETVEYALKNDKSELVRNMAKQCLKKYELA